MTRVIITGSKGRMGRALLACAAQHRELEIVGQIDQGDDLQTVIQRGEVVIDFSSHAVTPDVAELCARNGKAMVIGTTGHDDAEKSRITHHASRIPMVLSSNYSTGVNTLFWLTRKAAEILGPGYDLEVVEMNLLWHPDDSQEKESMIRLLERGIQQLNEHQKKCVELFYLDQKSYQEITDLTGYTMLNVKTHIQNGKRNLKIFMEKNHGR